MDKSDIALIMILFINTIVGVVLGSLMMVMIKSGSPVLGIIMLITLASVWMVGQIYILVA